MRDITELARFQHLHPSDAHLATILVHIDKGEQGGEFVVWDENTQDGGRYYGAYFLVRQYETAQATKVAAYMEFSRRLLDMNRRYS